MMNKTESNREAVTRAMSAMHLRPVLIAPHYDTLAVDLAAHMNAPEPKAGDEDRHMLAVADRYGHRADSDAPRKAYPFVGGVAVIPVHGILLNRLSWGSSWVTGYSYIRRLSFLADADPDVKGIAYDFNTFGGEAAGMFELAEDLSKLSKPTAAIIDSYAYSAGYALASVMKTVYVAPSGGVGSIGVRLMHIDFSKMLEDAGIKVELIYSGKHKVDGNPYNPLPDDVRKQFQAEIDQMRTEFATLVAENRGLPVQVVLDTEAQTYRAQDAVAIKLANHVLSPAKAFTHFVENLNGESDMTTQQTTAAAPAAPAATTAAAPAAPAAPAAAPVASTPAAPAQAATPAADQQATADAERARISGILGHEAAKDRPKLANTLAFTPSMSVETAATILAAAAKETPAATQNPLEAAMAAAEHPNVGAAGADAGGGDNGEGNADAAAILGAFASATGESFKDDAK